MDRVVGPTLVRPFWRLILFSLASLAGVVLAIACSAGRAGAAPVDGAAGSLPRLSTQNVTGALADPVGAVTEPLTDNRVLQPVSPLVEPVIQPLTDPLTPMIQPLMPLVEPLTPLVEPLVPVLAPVVDVLPPSLGNPTGGIGGSGSGGPIPTIGRGTGPSPVPPPFPRPPVPTDPVAGHTQGPAIGSADLPASAAELGERLSPHSPRVSRGDGLTASDASSSSSGTDGVPAPSQWPFGGSRESGALSPAGSGSQGAGDRMLATIWVLGAAALACWFATRRRASPIPHWHSLVFARPG